jgi:hypothetical protein
MTISEPVRKLIIRYMQWKGHSGTNAFEASQNFNCSVRSILRLINLHEVTGKYGKAI